MLHAASAVQRSAACLELLSAVALDRAVAAGSETILLPAP
jgi:hypothetical protein